MICGKSGFWSIDHSHHSLSFTNHLSDFMNTQPAQRFLSERCNCTVKIGFVVMSYVWRLTSVTRVYCDKMAKARITLLLLKSR